MSTADENLIVGTIKTFEKVIQHDLWIYYVWGGHASETLWIGELQGMNSQENRHVYISPEKKNSHQNCLSPYFLEIPNFPHQKQKKPPKRWAYIRESFFCINYLFQPPTKIPWFLLVDRSHILPRSQGTLVNLDQFRVVSRVPWRLYRWRLGGFWFKRLYGGGVSTQESEGWSFEVQIHMNYIFF